MNENVKNRKIVKIVCAIVYTLLLVVSACLIKLCTDWFSDKIVTTIITVGYVVLFIPLLVFIAKTSVKKMVVSDMVFLALMIAVQVIFSRVLSIQTPITKISLSFIPLTLCAMKLGVGQTMIMGGAADIIGSTLFPTGSYFPGFTLTEIIRGLIFGLFFRKKVTIMNSAAAVLISQIGCSLLLNTLWIRLIGSEFIPTLISRLPQVAIMIPIQIICIPLFSHTMNRISIKKISA